MGSLDSGLRAPDPGTTQMIDQVSAWMNVSSKEEMSKHFS